MSDDQAPLSEDGPDRGEDAADDETVSRCGTVALIGRPNVGKSTLLNSLLGLKIAATTHKPQTTRRQLRGVLTEGRDQVVFVDTPGIHDTRGDQNLHAYMVEQAFDAAANVDVIVLVVEAFLKKGSREEGGQKAGGAKTAVIDRRDEALLEELGKTTALQRPVILCINKTDRLGDQKQLLPLLKAWSEQGTFAALVPVSAQEKDGLSALTRSIREHLPESPFLFDPDAITDATERDICAELIREKAMLELREEIPYKLAVVVEEFDESRREDPKKPLVRIAAVIMVEREGQKGAVVGKGGSRIKTIGQRARKDLQRLLDCQVFLELFVRVEKDWTQSTKGLAKVGYHR
jgi:GTP-binding protein Era